MNGEIVTKMKMKKMNFPNSPTYGVIDDVSRRRADIGVAGAYVASERLGLVEMSTQHSSDCAAFITLASKALPRFVLTADV